MTPVIISTFVLVLLHSISVALAVHYCSAEYKEANKPSRKVILRVAAYSVAIFNTVLTIPIVSASMITLFCSQESIYHKDTIGCSSNLHFFEIFAAVINLIVVVIEAQFYWFFLHSKNPFSRSYFAIPSGLPRLGKFILKLVPTVYFAAGVSGDFLNLFNYLMVAMFVAFMFFVRINSIHSINPCFFRL